MKRFLITLMTAMAFTSQSYAQFSPGKYSLERFEVANFIKNPSCTNNTHNITAAGSTPGSVARTTSSPLEYAAACALSGNTAGDKLKFTSSTFDLATKGQNCEARAYYNGDASKWKAYVESGSSPVQITADYQLQDLSVSGNSGTVSINYPCGLPSDTKSLVFEATGSSPATIKVSGVATGFQTNLSTADSQSQWQNYVPTFDNITASATRMAWRRDGSDLLLKGSVDIGSTASGPGHIYFPDATMLVSSVPAVSSGKSTLACSVATDSDVNVTYVMQAIVEPGNNYATFTRRLGSNNDNPINPTNNMSSLIGSGTMSIDCRIPMSGWVTQTAIDSKNSNYGWTDFIPPTFSGFGSSSSDIIKCQHKREGPDLLVNCIFTVAGAAGTTAMLGLPTGLAISSSKWVQANIGTSGNMTPVGSYYTTSNFGSIPLVIASPGNTWVNFTFFDAGHGAYTPFNGNTVTTSSSILTVQYRVPIEGWEENQNAPQLVNSVISNLKGVMEVVGLVFTTSPGGTPCVLSQSTNSAVTVGSTSGGLCDISFNGIFSQPPICSLTATDEPGGTVANFAFGLAPISSGFTAQAFASSTGILKSVVVHAICVGQK